MFPAVHHDAEPRAGRSHGAAGAVRWLSLAAAPVFALLTLWTALPGTQTGMQEADAIARLTAFFAAREAPAATGPPGVRQFAGGHRLKESLTTTSSGNLRYTTGCEHSHVIMDDIVVSALEAYCAQDRISHDKFATAYKVTAFD